MYLQTAVDLRRLRAACESADAKASVAASEGVGAALLRSGSGRYDDRLVAMTLVGSRYQVSPLAQSSRANACFDTATRAALSCAWPPIANSPT